VGGEGLLNLAEASRGLKAGLLAVTDRRLIFLYSGFTETGKLFLEFPYERIASVDARVGIRGLLSASVIVVSDGTTHKFTDVVPRERAPEIGSYVAERIAGTAVS
jgi:hypothetical protein